MISVCMATYNGELFVEAQLLSILSQLSENDEVIISDDGSTDGTVDKINGLNDGRIKWAGLEGGLGIVKNFERALEFSNGDVIFLSDQDDVWLPGKVAQCIEVLKEHVLVVSDCCVVNAELEEITCSFFQYRKSGAGIIHNLIRNSYLGCCMAFRRELLSLCLPIPAKAPMHDMWIGLNAETIGGVKFLPQILLLYRRHGANASPTAGVSDFSLLGKIQYRLVLLRLLVARGVSNRIKML